MNSTHVFYKNVYGTKTYPGDLFDEPVTEDTLYDMASVSKVFATTSAIMKLYDQGMLTLEDKLVTYVPEANNNGKD